MNLINWALNHVFLIIAIASVIASALNKKRSAKPADELRDESKPAAPSESVRDIQAEIRRKIAERRSLSQPPSSVQPPVLDPPRLRPSEPSESDLHIPAPLEERREITAALRERLRQRLAAAKDREDAAVALEKRRRLAAEARAFEEEKREDKREPAFVHEPTPAAFPTTANVALNPLVASLREPGSLRRAILLREILGPPVSLR